MLKKRNRDVVPVYLASSQAAGVPVARNGCCKGWLAPKRALQRLARRQKPDAFKPPLLDGSGQPKKAHVYLDMPYEPRTFVSALVETAQQVPLLPDGNIKGLST